MKKFISVCMFIFPIISNAQKENAGDTSSANSISGIVTEILRLISIKKGEKHDLNKLRNLFLPTAQFTVLNHDDYIPQNAETVNLDEFLLLLQDPYYENGYLEYEIGRVVNEYNGIANVFQSFYGKDSEGDEEKGINSYQLVYFNNRWWIASMVWTLESGGFKIPERYQKN